METTFDIFNKTLKQFEIKNFEIKNFIFMLAHNHFKFTVRKGFAPALTKQWEGIIIFKVAKALKNKYDSTLP